MHQLDALSFDSEIMELMNQRLMRVFAYFSTDFVERFKPEITALLHFAIFRMSIWSSDWFVERNDNNNNKNNVIITKKD